MAITVPAGWSVAHEGRREPLLRMAALRLGSAGRGCRLLLPHNPVCYLKSTPEWSRLKAAILRFTRVLSDKNVFT